MALTQQELVSTGIWNSTIQEEVEKALGAKLDGKFTAVNSPAGMNYHVQPGGCYYNEGFLETLDSLVSTKDDIPSLGDSYSTFYNELIKNIAFELSTKAKELINREENENSALAETIYNIYKRSGLDDAPEPQTNIVVYIMKRIKEETGTSYLKLDTREYPHLALLAGKLSEYARRATNTSKLQNEWNEAYSRLEAINKHITDPDNENGGLQVSKDEFYVGWDKLPETKQLISSLSSKNSITISFSIDSFSSAESTLHLSNKAISRVPFNWLFKVAAEHQSQYDLSKSTTQNSKMNISMTFTGITMIAAIPQNLTNNNKKGWYAIDILNEVAAKSGKDETGYQFRGDKFDPKKVFGKDGQLKRIKTFVISQQPEINLHFSHFEDKKLEEFFNQKTKFSVSVLGGLINADHANGYSFKNINHDSGKQTLDVTLSPPPLNAYGSPEKQTAHVLGGVTQSINI